MQQPQTENRLAPAVRKFHSQTAGQPDSKTQRCDLIRAPSSHLLQLDVVHSVQEDGICIDLSF